MIDLTEDDNDITAQCVSTPPPKRLRTSESAAADTGPRKTPHKPTVGSSETTQLVTPSVPTEGSPNVVTSQQIASDEATQTLPTPDNTPEKNALYRLPELADRYVAKTSTVEGIEYTNPKKFALKPAYWRRWTKRHYSAFAEHLRAKFDPLPFARETGIPVEEVKHLFSSLVCNPLYFADEAKKRGEEGMQEIMELYEKCGTRSRPWGVDENGGKKMVGELHGVAPGIVKIILRNGSIGELKLSELSKYDERYLKETLTVEDIEEIKKKR